MRSKTPILILLLPALALCAACSGGDEAAASVAVHHPLASSIEKVRPELAGLGEEEVAAVDRFLRSAGPGAVPFELQRACRLVGKGLADRDPGFVAEFILSAAEDLYSDFFSAFDDAGLARIATALRDRAGMGEIQRLRMEAIVRRGRGVYRGPLAKALAEVPFSEVVSPRKLPLRDLTPRPDAPRTEYVGAAEILRLDAFVAEGAKRDYSVQAYRRALRRWAHDPVLLAGLAAVYAEDEERYGDELGPFLDKAAELDSRNAVYPYLKAVRYFRKGRDEEGLAALGEGMRRPVLTLHSLERSRAAADLLRRLGYGPIRAYLVSYRAVALGPYFGLKELANIALKRTYEYESAHEPGKAKPLLEFPVVLERQLRAAPHMLFAELLGGAVVTKGLSRLAEYQQTRNPGLASEYRDRAQGVRERLAAIDRGSRLCGGREAWGRLYDLLGERGFLSYIEGVLYGNEAAFLLACSDLGSLGEAKELAVRRYAF